MEEQIINPIPLELIEAELTPERFLRHTNKGNNHIYVVDAHNSPNVMREIGRLREIAFRTAGGGTGKSCDIDEFDTMNPMPTTHCMGSRRQTHYRRLSLHHGEKYSNRRQQHPPHCHLTHV